MRCAAGRRSSRGYAQRAASSTRAGSVIRALGESGGDFDGFGPADVDHCPRGVDFGPADHGLPARRSPSVGRRTDARGCSPVLGWVGGFHGGVGGGRGGRAYRLASDRGQGGDQFRAWCEGHQCSYIGAYRRGPPLPAYPGGELPVPDRDSDRSQAGSASDADTDSDPDTGAGDGDRDGDGIGPVAVVVGTASDTRQAARASSGRVEFFV